MRYLIPLILFLSATAYTADITITAANVNTISGTVVAGTFSYAATRGDLVVLSGGQWAQADADTDNGGKTHGVVVTPPIASGEMGVVQLDGVVDIGGTATDGVCWVASATAGKIAPYADLITGDYIVVVGFSEEDDVSNNNIDLVLRATSVTIP